MENITLKELAPYLPYHLMVINSVNKKVELTITDLDFRFKTGFKPVLRPLSDLKKEITIDRITFIPMNQFFRESRTLLKKEMKITKGKLMVDYLTWEILVLLFKWHFDVFRLIEKGLAIDINTLIEP